MRTRNMQFFLTLSLAALISVAGHSQSASGQLDPPHDDSSAIGCQSCHDMTAFDQPGLIPPPPSYDPDTATIDQTVFNLKCWECHDGVDAPYVETHSSLQASDKYGNWSVGCWVCHNQHNQYQPGFGYIRTTGDLSKIDGAGKTGVRNVHFPSYDPVTGFPDFADGDVSYDGICEVCHTLTTYFRNDGSAVDQNHGGRQGTNCMTCHNHQNGFIHGGGAGGNDCIACHGHDAGYEYSAGLFSQGKGTFKSHSAHTENDADDANGPNAACDACHDTNIFPFFKSGIDGDGDSKFNLAETNVCDPCHNDATGIATGSLILMPTPAWNTTSLHCGSCHQPDAYANGSPKANSHEPHTVFGCGTCHNATTEDGTTINDQSVHPDTLYTLQAGPGVSFTYTFDAAGGTCDTISCHGSQSATWGDTLGCDSCHAYPPVPGDGKDINDKFDGGKGVHVTSWDAMDAWGMGGHIINPASLDPVNDTYGDTASGYNECYKCHKDGTHANGFVEVQISEDPWSTFTNKGVYDRPGGFGLFGPPQYNGMPGDIFTHKTCSNIICHQGDTPRWTCPGGE